MVHRMMLAHLVHQLHDTGTSTVLFTTEAETLGILLSIKGLRQMPEGPKLLEVHYACLRW